MIDHYILVGQTPVVVEIGELNTPKDQGHTCVHVVRRRPGVELPDGPEWVTAE